MNIATRLVLISLVWVGIGLGVRATAADWAKPDRSVAATAEVIPPGQETSAGQTKGDTRMIEPDVPPIEDEEGVVGANDTPAQGLFGDHPPGVCEFCGGGNCLPPCWSVDVSAQIMNSAKPSDRVLGTTSLPVGPFQVTSGTIQGQPLQYGFINNGANSPALETHSPPLSDSGGLRLTLTHFLGRDGEHRDHLLEFEFDGLERFYGEFGVQGTTIPIYSPTATSGSQTTPPVIIGYTGSLISPFVFPVNLTTSPFQPTTQQTVQPAVGPSNPTNAYAFNGATQMSATSWSSFDSLEVNYRIANNNQPDQMVMNPNGHWYRQCRTGYFYSYLFGLRAMMMNEKYEFLASGETFNAAGVPILVNSGRYVSRTQNALLGLQTGGTLEYRFCRVSVDAHSKVGMFLNFANQDSLIQTQLVGQEYNNGPTFANGPAVDANTSTPFNAGRTVVAFAGGFGVGGSYKVTPNLVAHVSYDMLFVGDLWRAADQLQFGPQIIPQIDVRGNEYYNGFTFGLEYDW